MWVFHVLRVFFEGRNKRVELIFEGTMAYERKNMEPYGCAADTGDERFPSGGLRREDRGG